MQMQSERKRVDGFRKHLKWTSATFIRWTSIGYQTDVLCSNWNYIRTIFCANTQDNLCEWMIWRKKNRFWLDFTSFTRRKITTEHFNFPPDLNSLRITFVFIWVKCIHNAIAVIFFLPTFKHPWLMHYTNTQIHKSRKPTAIWTFAF